MKLFLSLFVFFVFTGRGLTQQRTLSYFIGQAKQNNQVLKDYQNQVLSNRIDSLLLHASLHTRVDFINNNAYAPVVGGYGYDQAITNLANVTSIVQASRIITGRNNLSAQYRSFYLQGQALRDTIELAEQDIVRTITEQYVTAYGDQLTAAYNKEVYELMQQEEAVLKKLTRSGTYKQTDYLSFYVTMQQQELLYEQSVFLYNTDYLTLHYLCGIQDTVVHALTNPDIEVHVPGDITQSVFYKRYVTDSLRLENQKLLLGFEYKPKIGLYTDAGYNSSLQIAPYKNFGVSAGINIAIPVYDGHQRRLKMSKLNLLENTRVNNRDFFLSQHYLQVSQLRQQLHLIDQLVDKIDRQIGYAYTLVKANNKLLESGDVTMKDYILAINNYIAAKNLHTQNYINRLRIASQLQYWNR